MTGRISNSRLVIIYMVVAACSVISQLLPLEWQASLKFDRNILTSTIYWSWFTAHLLHLNWIHLALNLTGLGLILVLFNGVWTYLRLAIIFLVTAATVIAALWIFSPEINWYVGLSGVLHGLLAAGALLSIKQHPGTSAIILTATLFKVAYEQFNEYSNHYLEQSIDGIVIIDAHLFGLIGGLLSAGALALLIAKKSITSTRKSSRDVV